MTRNKSTQYLLSVAIWHSISSTPACHVWKVKCVYVDFVIADEKEIDEIENIFICWILLR